ncbi:MAR-binding filament-like protein 1 isoform X2 [Phoenix dactylifera]|uniref:MAR-binding filament-like protein 1 isoform X2 n=1 Tax=Phoenix dactylifera TaxID=42345 RepID=A0A8B8ZYY6_PHODC|nr:MAR-binding filament-like protein 1 isoform X2 [Phoenix dactylifera]
MGGHENSRSSSSDRRQWQRIFGTLVEMLQSRQSQIETLADDRKFLERYIRIQNDRWASKARFLESHIAQMKEEERKGRRVQAAKLDLMVGIKEREALCYKIQHELAESDSEDFHACAETLSAEISELKEKMKGREVHNGRAGFSEADPVGNPKKDDRCNTALEDEIRKLKHAYKRLSSEKESEVSALLAEKEFVWNKFKDMEKDYTDLLKSKRIEVEQAEEAMEKLVRNLEKLQSSASEKDETISGLEAERARLELDLRRQTQEAKEAIAKLEQIQLDMEQLRTLAKERDETIAKLRSDLAKIEMDATKGTNTKSVFFKDLDSWRNSRNASITPVESCVRSSRKRKLESARGVVSQKHKRATEDSAGSRISSTVNGVRQCSIGRQTRTFSPVDSPRLFSANFKVPKLKSFSTAVL